MKTWLQAALGIAGIGLIVGARAPVAALHHAVKEASDEWYLPTPQGAVVSSLGYRSAMADYLWSNVVVQQGFHSMDRRRFDNLIPLFDTINELDPTFRDPYLMADAFITMQVNETPVEELRAARRIMERGVRERPLDGELWGVLGQFVGFIAPAGMLKDPAEIAQWKQDAAPYLARAAELGTADVNIAWQALAGGGIYYRAGQRDAAIRFYQKILSVTDDEELRGQTQRLLDALLGEQGADAARQRDREFAARWKNDLSYVPKSTLIALGPGRDPYACAGRAPMDEGCAMTWRQWGDRRAALEDASAP